MSCKHKMEILTKTYSVKDNVEYEKLLFTCKLCGKVYEFDAHGMPVVRRIDFGD